MKMEYDQHQFYYGAAFVEATFLEPKIKWWLCKYYVFRFMIHPCIPPSTYFISPLHIRLTKEENVSSLLGCDSTLTGK